jgi:putative ABC transport system permease protein
LRGRFEPEEVPTVRASANLFTVLGVSPALGRGFLRGEDSAGRARVVVVSHAFWTQRLGADRRAIGSTLVLDDEPYTVVGVMPAGFRFPDDDAVAMWTPLVYLPFETRTRSQRMFNGLARLAPTATLTDACAELATVSARLAAEFPRTNQGWTAVALPAGEVSRRPAREPLLVLLGAVGCVLLIACANVGNLFLARGLERHQELAVRSALGAERGRLVRQLLTEVLVVTAAGAAVGLLLAWWGLDLLLALEPGHLPHWNPVRIDGPVLAFTAALIVLTAVAAGLAPAVHAARPDLAPALRQGTKAMVGPARRRLRHALVVSQVALSLVLLVGAALMIKSLDRLLRVDPGFQLDSVLTATLYLTDHRYPDNARQAAFFAELLERVRHLPGVVAAGAVTTLPFSTDGIDHDMPVAVADRLPPPGEEPEADFRIASPGYFEALRIPVIAGRSFGEQDHADAPPVVIVNQAFVDRFLAGTAPLDRRVRWGRTGPLASVVGVVASLRHRGFDDVPRPELYVPYQQMQYGAMTLAIRTAGDPLALAEPVKRTVLAIDPAQPVSVIAPLADLARASSAERRFNMSMLLLFAALAVGLAAVGMYGVVSYLVTQRTREFGLRMALGARGGTVFRQVLGDGLRIAGVGIVVGAVTALAFTRFLRNLLFQVQAHDPGVLAIGALLLVLVAAVACGLPALRATRVDPMTALRTD